MYPFLRRCFPIALLLFAGPVANAQNLTGSWVADLDQSVDLDPWREFRIDISLTDSTITTDRFWGAGRYAQRDSMTVPIGREVEIPVRPGKWMDHVYLGVFVPEQATRRVRVDVSDQGRSLEITSVTPLQTSQIDTTVTVKARYQLSVDMAEMTLTEQRSSRTHGPPLIYRFTRE